MILAIDIGNTNIVIGCMEGDKCSFIERLSTVRTKTELEYAIDIKMSLISTRLIRQLSRAGSSSVVPPDYKDFPACGRKDPEKGDSDRWGGYQDRTEYPHG